MNPARHRECLCERKSGTKRKKIGGTTTTDEISKKDICREKTKNWIRFSNDGEYC